MDHRELSGSCLATHWICAGRTLSAVLYLTAIKNWQTTMQTFYTALPIIDLVFLISQTVFSEYFWCNWLTIYLFTLKIPDKNCLQPMIGTPAQLTVSGGGNPSLFFWRFFPFFSPLSCLRVLSFICGFSLILGADLWAPVKAFVILLVKRTMQIKLDWIWFWLSLEVKAAVC